MTEPSPLNVAFQEWANALDAADATARAASEAHDRAEAALSHLRSIARGFGEKKASKP